MKKVFKLAWLGLLSAAVLGFASCQQDSSDDTKDPVVASIEFTKELSDKTLSNGQAKLKVTVSAVGEVTYTWYLDGEEIDDEDSNTYIATQAGTYKVVAVATSNGTSAKAESSCEVFDDVIIDKPTLTVSQNDEEFTLTDSVTSAKLKVTATTENADKVTYAWSKDGSLIDDEDSATYYATKDGIYTCKVTASNSNGSTTKSVTFKVTYNPTDITLTVSQNLTSATLSDSVTSARLKVTATAENADKVTYAWYKGGSLIDDEDSATYYASEAGTYVCKVTASNDSGSTSKSVTFTVTNNPVEPTVSITSGLSGAELSDTVKEVTLTVSATGNGELKYSWTKDGTVISDATSSSYKASEAGTYEVTVTCTLNGKTVSDKSSCTVTSTPNPDGKGEIGFDFN